MKHNISLVEYKEILANITESKLTFSTLIKSLHLADRVDHICIQKSVEVPLEPAQGFDLYEVL